MDVAFFLQKVLNSGWDYFSAVLGSIGIIGKYANQYFLEWFLKNLFRIWENIYVYNLKNLSPKLDFPLGWGGKNILVTVSRDLDIWWDLALKGLDWIEGLTWST